MDNPNELERDAARSILSWAARAERPLLWKEIQSLFCIDLEKGIADADFKLTKSCKHFCGALVEVDRGHEYRSGPDGAVYPDAVMDPDGVVELVHETARM
jgi:hypothetical protein